MEYHPPWQQVGGNAAEVYERQLVPVMLAPWAPKLIDLAEVRPGMHVLDVACGTGVVTRLAAERVGSGGRVVGLDINAAMLSVARRLAPVGGASRRVAGSERAGDPPPRRGFRRGALPAWSPAISGSPGRAARDASCPDA